MESHRVGHDWGDLAAAAAGLLRLFLYSWCLFVTRDIEACLISHVTRGHQSTWLRFSVSWVCLKQHPRKPCTQTQHHIMWCCRIVSWRRLLAKSSLLSLSFFFFFNISGRYQAQNDARSSERKWGYQSLPQGRCERQRPSEQGKYRPAEQNVSLWNLWRARQLGDTAETGRQSPPLRWGHAGLQGLPACLAPRLLFCSLPPIHPPSFLLNPLLYLCVG